MLVRPAIMWRWPVKSPAGRLVGSADVRNMPKDRGGFRLEVGEDTGMVTIGRFTIHHYWVLTIWCSLLSAHQYVDPMDSNGNAM